MRGAGHQDVRPQREGRSQIDAVCMGHDVRQTIESLRVGTERGRGLRRAEQPGDGFVALPGLHEVVADPARRAAERLQRDRCPQVCVLQL